jgi:hypothetical protein
MTNEHKQPVKFVWSKPKEPKPQIYTNYVHLSWSLFDVRFLLGQLVPSDPGLNTSFVVEEQGSVVLAWPEAKLLRDMLIGLVDSYEKTNGEIKPLQLPPVPAVLQQPPATNPPEE